MCVSAMVYKLIEQFKFSGIKKEITDSLEKA